MKQDQVQLGRTYRAKVSGKLVHVRIEAAHPQGGWSATNLTTHKSVRIASAQRLRGRVRAKPEPPAAETPGEAWAPASAPAPKAAGMSALEAATQVLREAGGGPLNCGQMIERMLARGDWTTRGRTPQATLRAALTRTIRKHGAAARFQKTGRGCFGLRQPPDQGKTY